MLKDSILERIMCIGIHCDDEITKNAFYAYLSGETDQMPNPKQKNLHVYPYCLEWDNFENDEEYIEIGKRFLRFSITYNQNTVITYFLYNRKKYKYYVKLDLDKSFLEQDLISTLNSISNLDNIGFSGPRAKEILEEIFLYYGDIITRWINEFENYDRKKQLSALVLLAYAVKKQQTKNKELLEKLKSIFLTALYTQYSQYKIQKEFKRESDLSLLEQYQKINLKCEKEDCNKFLFVTAYFCFGIDKQLDDMIRIYLILMPPKLISAYFTAYRYKYDDVRQQFIEKYHLPDRVVLDYCAYLFSLVNGGEKDVALQEIIRQIMKENPEEFIEVLKRLMQEKELRSSILLVQLLKENHSLAPIFLKSIETTMLTTLYVLQERGKTFSFTNGSNDFSCLHEKDFDPNMIEGNFNIYQQPMGQLCTASIYLMGYSTIATNLVKLFIKNVNGYMINFLGILSVYPFVCPAGIDGVFDYLYETVGLPLETITRIYLNSLLHTKQNLKDNFMKLLQDHKQEAEEGLKTYHYDIEELKKYMMVLYQEDYGFDPCALLSTFDRKSKTLVNCAEDLLADKEELVREQVEKLQQAKSKMVSDVALRLIRRWDNEKIDKQLEQLKTVEELKDYIEKQYVKNNDKSLPYVKEINYNCVRQADSEELLPEILVKYYISEYILLKELYIIKTCKKIQEFANIYDLRALVKQIFEMWISDGASVKYKNILLPFALSAGETQLTELKKQIDFWSENSKPALAAFAIQSLCMNGSKMALLLTDTMSKKHKSKKVKTAALEALDIISKEMGISKEELDDLIVPDLGFQQNREKIFDYGVRKFKGVLNDKMEIILFDETGKQIKSLPKAASKYEDNEDKVTAAKEELKTVKKQIKVIIDSQKSRMFHAVLSGRSWTVEKWKDLFIKNPIMLPYATGLIWEELDTDGSPMKSFRYMDDGTLNTSEEEEYELSENSIIRLLHPVNIDADEVKQWKQQLEDYEIIQPVEQLSIPVYTISEENQEKQDIIDFQKIKVYGATFKSIVTKLGLSLLYDSYGEITGCFYKDEQSNITMYFYTSSFYTGDYNSPTELKVICFKEDGNGPKLCLKDVPPKLLSMAMLVGTMISAKKIEQQP